MFLTYLKSLLTVVQCEDVNLYMNCVSLLIVKAMSGLVRHRYCLVPIILGYSVLSASYDPSFRVRCLLVDMGVCISFAPSIEFFLASLKCICIAR